MGIYGTRDGKFHVKKLTVDGKMPVHFSISNVLAFSSTYFVAAWDIASGTSAGLTSPDFSYQPPYPVELSVHAVAAGTTDGAAGDGLVFIGYNAKGDRIRETIYVSSAAGTAASAYTYTSNAFAKITSITPDDALHKSSDVNIGFRNIVGLPYQIESASDILSARLGIQHGTAAVTVDAVYDSVDLTSVTAGSTVDLLWDSKVQ